MNLSTHALNTATGLPAQGLEVILTSVDSTGLDLEVIARAATDDDGRHRFTGSLNDGTYRLRFSTGPYFAAADTTTLYPLADVVFTVDNSTSDHIHIPLLLSPFGYSTYRGS